MRLSQARQSFSVILAIGVALLLATEADAGSAVGINGVISIGHVSSSEGWILMDRRLLVSDDDGASWREDAFIAPPGARLLTAQFLDRLRGWVVVTDGGTAYVMRTVDAGSSWNSSNPLSIPEGDNASGASLSFVTDRVGYLVLRLPSGSNLSRGVLFRTGDRGRTWRLLPSPPIGDNIKFVSEEEGWLAGGPTGSDLFVTRDGGSSWSAVSVSPPAESPEARPIYSLPVFSSRKIGLLPVSFETPEISSITLYSTRDGGSSWIPLGSTPYSAPGRRPLDMRDQTVITTDSDGIILTLSRAPGYGTVTRKATIGSPLGSNVALISFADLRRGWVATDLPQCADFKAACWHEIRILRTRDSGVKFEDITPAFLLQANQQSEESARNSGLHKPSGAFQPKLIGNGTVIQQNRSGFDMACYPSASTMQAWWDNSTYYYVGAYIGGTHAYCVNHSSTCPCPSASWFSQTASQGWTYIPTWVGIQEYFGDLSSNTITAYNQGVSEANAAADRMAVLGFPQGSIVYFDFERPHPASIEPSVKAFVNGWSSQLHVRGHNAGIYGSYLSAAAWQGSGVPNPPDAIWPYNLNVGQTVFNLCGPSYCLPNDIWSNHQRIHQYSQNVSDTHGGISLNIDQDFADGPVATYGASVPTCTSFSINPTGVSPTAASGSQGVTVTGSPSGCQGGSWSASGNGSWLTVSPTGGTGSGSATVFWTQNTSSSSRSATATIAGRSFSVNQAGSTPPTCTSFSINPTGVSPTAASGSQGVTVTGSPSGCQGGSWSASGNGSWLTVSPTGGTGSGSATVFWTQNTSSSPRSATAAIAGRSFSVNQAGSTPPTCTSFSINPTGASPTASGGSQVVTVTGSPSGCQGGNWSASGNGSWLTVSPTGGTGSGSATVSWTQNTSTSARSGSATIAGNSFNVNQSGQAGQTCYILTRSHLGSGSDPTASPGSSVGCSAGQYQAGAIITLTASPSSGWSVGSWSGTNNNGSTSTTNTATMPPGNLTVTANYVQSSDTALSNAVPYADSVTGASSQSSWKYYYADVGAGSTSLVATLSALSADADLYVRYNTKPTLADWDCRPYSGGTATEQCTFSTPAAGRWWIGVNNYDVGTINYQVTAAWTGGTPLGLNFYTVTPCRLMDTRSGLPASSGNRYWRQVTGLCGIPGSAAAVAANVTVVDATGPGYVILWPGDLSQPGTSTISFNQGQVRANNALMTLATDGLGDISYAAFVSGNGSVHLILDVSGYFAP